MSSGIGLCDRTPSLEVSYVLQTLLGTAGTVQLCKQIKTIRVRLM